MPIVDATLPYLATVFGALLSVIGFFMVRTLNNIESSIKDIKVTLHEFQNNHADLSARVSALEATCRARNK